VAFSMTVKTISNWIISGLLFPISTVRYRLEGQGATTTTTTTKSTTTTNTMVLYSSEVQAVVKLLQEEGWQALFTGYEGHLISLLSSMSFIFCFYCAGRVLIFFANDQPNNSLYNVTLDAILINLE